MEELTSFKSSSHSAYRLQYHIIFTVKYRKPIITKAMLDRLEEIFSDVCGKWRCRLVEFGGEADH
ncbi:MAG: IS200/IS605 family transposase, partial [Halothece sp. Uz-M2-17]|nr:IS200/IS605 family transposase [Halothece sp. Uz-M2-17]